MKRILIIDDDEEMCAELGEVLNGEGCFEVEAVFDGDSGRRSIEKNAYDVIILDLKLPKLNGYEVLKNVRQAARPVKVLVLSGRPLSGPLLNQDENRKKDEEEMILALADAVMNKPFMIDIFLAQVKGLAGIQAI